MDPLKVLDKFIRCLKSLAKVILPGRYRPTLALYYRKVQPVLSVLYIGNRVVCPHCGGHFRKFRSTRGGRSFRAKARPNAVCPRCLLAERHRLLWLYLKNRTYFFSDNLRVLHFAPEEAFQKSFSTLPNLDYTSGDLNSPLAMVRLDITDIFYKDNFFDVILCSHVLPEVEDDQRAIRELFRVLKPGGWAIIQSQVDLGRDKTFEDPRITSPEDRERFFGHPTCVRIYGRDYKDRLGKTGFNVKVERYAQELGPDVIRKYGLREDQDIYLCTKPKPETGH